MTPLQAAHEACDEYGISHDEMHHYRGRGKMQKPFDDLILLSVIPVSTAIHAAAHLHEGKDWPLSEWLRTATRDEMAALIHAMIRQTDILRMWKDVDKVDRP
jgi:hypothetical protein